MKIIFAILFWIIGPQVMAQTAPPIPPVFPAQLGSAGSPFKAGQTADGRWLAWQYTVNGVLHTYTLCAPLVYEIIHPDTTGLTPIRAARAYWTANVMYDCAAHPTMRRLVLEAHRAFAQ